MYKLSVVIIAGVLMTGPSFSQESSLQNVDNILKELVVYDKTTNSATEEPPQVKTPSGEQPAEKEVSVVRQEQPGSEEGDLEKMMKTSRRQYVNGEFERAQRGFEEIVKRNPEDVTARIYLRKILERNHRLAETSGIDAVDAAWGIEMVQRSYAMTCDDAVKKMELNESKDAMDVSAKFPEVDFPEGAAAVYQPKLERVFVRNTRENLEVLEEILNAMDISKPLANIVQIEIEAKFVEVSEGTLEELGFEWNFANSEKLLGGVTANDGSGLFADGLRGGSASPALPFSRPGDLGMTSAGAGDWKAFRFEDTFNNTADSLQVQYNGSSPFDVLISALDQSSGADVLSAPRIVTANGEKALIQIGQLHSYPTVYTANQSAANITQVTYNNFEDTLLGVELEVTPKVNGDQIDLSLNPKIKELAGWDNYEIAPADSSFTTFQTVLRARFFHDPVVARLPVFKTREIQTKVSIADGGTMGMGGLISDRVESYEDKVPVLGSLPLIGRFFRNEGERSIKCNLLMFVTAKTVSPSGRISTERSFQ
jgi:type II secretory pathway component GspD/PulD (secretin)